MPLKHLYLAECSSVTDSGLEVLRGMPLAILDLCGTQTSDAGLEFLEGLPLVVLSLAGTLVTSAGLRFLEDAPLRELFVDGCEGMDMGEFAVFWQKRYAKEADKRTEVEERLAEVEARLLELEERAG